MAKRNLADPDFEPTDEQFAELLRRAGDDARASSAEAERVVRALVEAERAKHLAALRARAREVNSWVEDALRDTPRHTRFVRG